jgi:predicted transcriptional regulator
MSEVATVYDAISYPLRREIIDLLFESPKTINEISKEYSISRQGVTKHLIILKEAKLINIETQGREKLCSVTLNPLLEVNSWIKKYDQFWNNKLDDLEEYLESK